MKHTWTVKELNSTSMKRFIVSCLYDRKDGLIHIDSPLYKKIDEAIEVVMNQDFAEDNN